MSTNVGSVNIAVTGNIAPLQQSLAQATTQSNTFASNVGDKLRGFASNVGSAMQVYAVASIVALGAAMVAAAAKALDFSGEVNTAMKSVQIQTGASAEEMVGLKESMMGVYASGLTDNMGEAAAAISTVKRITGETGDALIATTTDALAFGQAFDKDVTEVMAGARGMMNGFGISAEQSMDLAAYAIQKTGDPAGDLLDTLTEYSPLMNQIGLDAEQFTAGLIGGLEGGAFNTDQLGDALKEFGIGIMEDISVVGPKMTEVLAAAGDEGAQAWLGIRDEIEAASAEVDKHKSALDEAKSEWDKTNAKVVEYQGELDKAMGKLMQALNPSLDLSKYTDTLRSLEQEAIQIKLTMPDDTPAIEAAKSRMEDALGQIDKEGDGITSRIKELQQQARKASEEEKAAIDSKIAALQAEKEQLGARRDAIREGFEAEMDAYENSPQQRRLDEIKRLSEQQTLLMKQEKLAAEQIALNAAKSKGLTEGQIKGQIKLGDVESNTLGILGEVSAAQQNLNEASADENIAKQQLDQAQMSYDQALAIVKDLELTAEQMSNPGEAMGIAFQKGGADAAAAMKQFAASLLKAKETMSDAEFKALAREAGFGTLAEEMGADALAGMLRGIANPGNIAKDAAGTVDDVADTIVDRWTQAWNRLDVVLGSLGTSFGDVWATVLPGFESVVEMAEKILPPILKELGGVLGESMKNITPLITEVIKYLAAEGLVTFMAIAKAIGLILPPVTKFLGDNAGWLAPLVGWLLTLAGILGTGGAIYGGIMSLIASLSPLWAMVAPFMAGGAMSAAFATVTAGLSSVVAFLSPIIVPLALIGLAVAALYYAWTTNLGGIQEITWSVLGGVTTFITTKFSELQTWWATHNTEVLARFNAAWGALGILINLALMPVMAAIEGFKLFWGAFGDDIINFIKVAFLNATTVVIGGLLIFREGFALFLDVIKGNWSGAWEHLKNIATIGKNVITDVLNNFLSIFGTNIDGIVNYFADLPGRIAAYFSPEALIKIATDAMQAFSDTITAMMPSLPDPSDLMGGLPSLSGAMSSAQNLVSGTAASVTGAIPSPTSNSFNQSLSFNQPGASADDIARSVRRQTIDLLRQAMS